MTPLTQCTHSFYTHHLGQKQEIRCKCFLIITYIIPVATTVTCPGRLWNSLLVLWAYCMTVRWTSCPYLWTAAVQWTLLPRRWTTTFWPLRRPAGFLWRWRWATGSCKCPPAPGLHSPTAAAPRTPEGQSGQWGKKTKNREKWWNQAELTTETPSALTTADYRDFGADGTNTERQHGREEQPQCSSEPLASCFHVGSASWHLLLYSGRVDVNVQGRVSKQADKKRKRNETKRRGRGALSLPQLHCGPKFNIKPSPMC